MSVIAAGASEDGEEASEATVSVAAVAVAAVAVAAEQLRAQTLQLWKLSPRCPPNAGS